MSSTVPGALSAPASPTAKVLEEIRARGAVLSGPMASMVTTGVVCALVIMTIMSSRTSVPGPSGTPLGPTE